MEYEIEATQHRCFCNNDPANDHKSAASWCMSSATKKKKEKKNNTKKYIQKNKRQKEYNWEMNVAKSLTGAQNIACRKLRILQALTTITIEKKSLVVVW